MRTVALKIAWVLVGVMFIAGATWQLWGYLTGADNAIQVITDARDGVYKRVRAEWFRPTVADVKQGAASEPVDQFDLMATRAALGRWRLQKIAPNAYTRLEEDFERGLWAGDWRQEFRTTFEALDEAWLRARAKAITSNDIPATPTLRVLSERGMQVQFVPGTLTSQLGSVLVVDFVASRVPIRKAPAVAAWATHDFPDPSLTRIRTCIAERTDQRHEGRYIYRMILDMSEEPMWLDPECQPLWITFNGDGDTTWRPLSLRFYDSEHLRPRIERQRFVP